MWSPATFSTIHATIHLWTGDCTCSMNQSATTPIPRLPSNKTHILTPEKLPTARLDKSTWTVDRHNSKCQMQSTQTTSNNGRILPKPWRQRIIFSGLISLMNSHKSFARNITLTVFDVMRSSTKQIKREGLCAWVWFKLLLSARFAHCYCWVKSKNKKAQLVNSKL